MSKKFVFDQFCVSIMRLNKTRHLSIKTYRVLLTTLYTVTTDKRKVLGKL